MEIDLMMFQVYDLPFRIVYLKKIYDNYQNQISDNRDVSEYSDPDLAVIYAKFLQYF